MSVGKLFCSKLAIFFSLFQQGRTSSQSISSELSYLCKTLCSVYVQSTALVENISADAHNQRLEHQDMRLYCKKVCLPLSRKAVKKAENLLSQERTGLVKFHLMFLKHYCIFRKKIMREDDFFKWNFSNIECFSYIYLYICSFI